MPTEELNQLQILLDDILEDKTTNLTPDTLREGVVCLGIEGKYKGTDTTDATAKGEHILEGESAYVNGEKIEGTMPNNGELIYDPSDEEQPIPEGYTSGGAVLKTDITKLNEYKICLGLANELDTSEGYVGATAKAADILMGATAYNYGEKLVGTMANNGELNYVPLDEEQEIPAGYTTGGTIAATDIEELNEYQTCLTLANSINTTKDYTDTTATAEDIRKGKIAYANGERIEGTLDVGATTMDIEITGTGSLRTFVKSISSIDLSQVTEINSLFKEYYVLEKAPKMDTSKITKMYGMFQSCRALKVVEGLDTSSLENAGQMFLGCKSLETAPDMNLSKLEEAASMFSGCEKLKNIPQYNIVAPKMTNMFSNCPLLTDESLNNIMAMCANSIIGNSQYKSLQYIGLTEEQATKCQTLSNYQTFTAAGWTTGY